MREVTRTSDAPCRLLFDRVRVDADVDPHPARKPPPAPLAPVRRRIDSEVYLYVGIDPDDI